jgi:hypothetical protein
MGLLPSNLDVDINLNLNVSATFDLDVIDVRWTCGPRSVDESKGVAIRVNLEVHGGVHVEGHVEVDVKVKVV